MANNELRPLWYVMAKSDERTIAICDNEDDANSIADLYKAHKDTECVIRITFTR